MQNITDNTIHKKRKEEDSEKFQSSPFEVIPEELMLLIIQYLEDPLTIISLRSISKRFKQCIESSQVWRSHFTRRWPEKYDKMQSDLPHNGWWDLYSHQSRLSNRWHSGQCKIYTLEAHLGAVCCVRFEGDRMVSSSEDHSIKIWDLKSGQCIRTYSGHMQAVWCTRMENDYLVSAGGDAIVKIWDMKKHKCLKTLAGHRGEVWCVDLNTKNNRVASGSVDSTVNIYDFETGDRLQSLTGHTSSVFALQLWRDYLVSGSKDGVTKLHDLRVKDSHSSMYEIVSNYRNSRSPIFSLQMDDEKLVTGHGDGSITVSDLRSEKSSYKVHCHTDSVWSLNFNEEHIVTGSVDKTIKILQWGASQEEMVAKPTPLHAIRNGLFPVFSVQLGDSQLISGDASGSIQVMDFDDTLTREWGSAKQLKLEPDKQTEKMGTMLHRPSATSIKYDEEGKLDYSVF